MKHRFLEMTIDALREAVAADGGQAYRAGQLADWVYHKGVTDPEKMTNLPGSITREFEILTSTLTTRSDSEDGCTKLLIRFSDGRQVETVLIPDQGRATACVSTQAGCAMGCVFCASGLRGLQRNLTAGEILEQVIHLRQATGQAVTNVVFMGMGEPLANYDATLMAVKSLIDPDRFGLSARRITVSTVGLPRQIRRLAKERIPITLAISLHAPHDALRRELLPVATKYPLEEVLSAAEVFYQERKREITLEYVLLSGVNDTPVCAEGLSRIARRLRSNVNLIVYNPVPSLPFARPAKVAVTAFEARLRRHGVNVHIRRSRGLNADAACGQLRLRKGSTDSRR
jgi:23S rRNA (adenine2503-C2)-methyltransferase